MFFIRFTEIDERYFVFYLVCCQTLFGLLPDGRATGDTLINLHCNELKRFQLFDFNYDFYQNLQSRLFFQILIARSSRFMRAHIPSAYDNHQECCRTPF